MSLIVVMATVPWRRESCERTLASLASQTRVPDAVILHLDGYAHDEAPPSWPENLRVQTKQFARARGVGNWWRSVGREHERDLIACVGDDFTYLPDYMARLEAGQRRNHGAVCWHGRGHQNALFNFRMDCQTSVPIVRAGTAMFLAPGSSLIGMCDHPLARIFFSPDGHDEAFVSWWLSSHKIPLRRLAGKPPIKHHAEGQDPRATSRRFAHRKTALRRLLYDLFGWPGGNERADAAELERAHQQAIALGYTPETRRPTWTQRQLQRSTLGRRKR